MLLDTNAVIALFRNDPVIVSRLKTVGEVFLCTVVLGELYYGVAKSSQTEKNLQILDEFVSQNVIIDVNEATARQYGSIKGHLRKKGRPIPENDIWIAAIAMQYNLTLLTRDDHFTEVDNLIVETW